MFVLRLSSDVVLTGELLGKDSKPPGTAGQPSVSFAEGTSFERDRTGKNLMILRAVSFTQV